MEKGNKCPECGKTMKLIKDCGEVCNNCGFAMGVDVE